MEKRGSHVEVVLSFVIFIIFLIFLYPLLIEPAINIEKDNSYLLDNLEKSIIENTSSNVTTLSFNSGSSAQACINLNNFLTTNNINSKLIAKDYFGNAQILQSNGNSLQINRTNLSETFFKIYNSEEFSSISSVPVSPCNTIGYIDGFTNEKDYIFEKKLNLLVDFYENDYENLKETLSLPENGEFDFTFTHSNGTTIGIKKNVSASIFAEEKQVEYFSINNQILLGKLNVRVY